jgi:hypothetical protein
LTKIKDALKQKKVNDAIEQKWGEYLTFGKNLKKYWTARNK